MRYLVVILLALLVPADATAHIGSPEVYYDGTAGPYQLFVTVRPPEVIPGVADIQIRAATSDIDVLRIVPLPLVGEGAQFSPTPDVATRLPGDAQTFTGHLWMMTAGAWQVRVTVEGRRGPGELAVPVPTLPQRTAGMQTALGVLLGGLLLILVLGMIRIAGAFAGEATLEPGLLLSSAKQRQQRWVMAQTAVVLLALLYGGARWWQAEAAKYDQHVYRPLAFTAQVDGTQLRLTMSNPGGQRSELDDLVPDHDHLMHLFMLRMPAMDQVWHLHPSADSPGIFVQNLPALAAGRYQLYADIVHQTGVPETLVAELVLPTAVAGQPLAGDDAMGTGRPLPTPESPPIAPLSGGAQMVWVREPGPLVRGTPYWFRFRIEDRPGHAAEDLELYMGMLGHAAFVKHDGSVFVHLHPSGSVPMAMLTLSAPASSPHAGHHHGTGLPAEVSFPYGFPQPGDYRLVVQIKRQGKVETGVFDAHVQGSKPAAKAIGLVPGL